MKPLHIGVFILSTFLPHVAAGGTGAGAAQHGGYGGNISCGIGKTSPLTRRILGGSQAKPEEIPWQVSFRWETGTGRSPIFCGGSLIDKKWVMSAAHCFLALKFVPPSYKLKAVLGEFDVWNKEGNEVVFDINRVILPPNFENRGLGGFRNDIALVELQGEVSFNDYMKPVCLPERNINFSPGEMCTVTGFGGVSEDGYRSLTLRKTNVPIIDHQKFSKLYGPRALFAGTAGKGSCYRDEGGPLACQKNGKFYLTGVLSGSIGCARPGYPGVYANVKLFMNWIKQTMRTNVN